MADRIYRVNMKRLALLALPTWLRRPVCGALVYAGISPLGRLLHELRGFRERAGFRLGHNGQVCKLRGALNDTFDSEHRRIIVYDGGASWGDTGVTLRRRGMGHLVTYRRGEGIIISRRGMGGASEGIADFYVGVPAELYRNESERRRIYETVRQYRLASKRFEIKETI